MLSRQKPMKNHDFIGQLVNFWLFDGHFIAAECESGRFFSKSKPCDLDLFVLDSDSFRPDCHLFSRESPEKVFLRRLNLNKAACRRLCFAIMKT